MLRLEQVRLPLDPRCARDPEPLLIKRSAALLGVKASAIKEVIPVRHAVDALDEMI